jgi:hypothetical protein
MNRRNLFCTYSLDSEFDFSLAWTRQNTTKKNSNGGTLLDAILVSDNLRDRVKSTIICHYPDNLSDHCPVEMNFELFLDSNHVEFNRLPPERIDWKNLKPETKQEYCSVMDDMLETIEIPFHQLLHGSCIRDDSEHIFAIEKYFSEVINAVNVADRHLPRVKLFVRKDYWNEE